MVTAAVNSDRATARRWARHHLAFYGVIPYFDTMFTIHGFEREAAAIRAAAATGYTAGMIAAVSEEMIDVFSIAGTPDEARARLMRLERPRPAGVVPMRRSPSAPTRLPPTSAR